MPPTVLTHPLAAHLLTVLRDKETAPEQFRRVAATLTTLLVLEGTRDLTLAPTVVETPLEAAEGLKLHQSIAVVPVLRAGLGMLESIVELFPDVAVGYIGLERHHDTAIAHSYYCKLPDLRGRYCLCVDPMLATGGSAAQAISLMKSQGAEKIVMLCVVASPEGIERVQSHHPEVPIITAGIDRGLNDRKYIVPGLGDFGDRLYGTL